MASYLSNKTPSTQKVLNANSFGQNLMSNLGFKNSSGTILDSLQASRKQPIPTTTIPTSLKPVPTTNVPTLLKPLSQPIKPIINSPGIITPAIPPVQHSYNTQTGLLTDYGKSQGLPEVNKESLIEPKFNINTKQTDILPKINVPSTSTNPAIQSQNVGQAGQQTANEVATQARLIEQSKTTGPEYQKINEDLAKIRENIRLSKENYAKSRTDLYSEPGSITLKEGRDKLLAQQYGMEQTALSEQANALADQLSSANTQQGLQQTAAQGAYAGAQAQAGRGLTAQGQVLTAGLMEPTAIGTVPFSALTGEQGGMIGGQGGLSQLGALQTQQKQGSDTQTMIGAYNQAKPLIETAKQQIASTKFNISPIALVNELNQYINKNVIPSGEYANIFNTLSEIATTISPVLGAQGAQTDLKTMISQEFIPKLLQGQDLSSVFDNIEKNALAKIEANKLTAQGTPLNVPAGSTGDNTVSAGGFNFKLVNGKYVPA